MIFISSDFVQIKWLDSHTDICCNSDNHVYSSMQVKRAFLEPCVPILANFLIIFTSYFLFSKWLLIVFDVYLIVNILFRKASWKHFLYFVLFVKINSFLRKIWFINYEHIQCAGKSSKSYTYKAKSPKLPNCILFKNE